MVSAFTIFNSENFLNTNISPKTVYSTKTNYFPEHPELSVSVVTNMALPIW